MAVNELPELPDDAGALKPRLTMLHFRKTYAGREDTTLKRRLKREAAGVAIWALEGLRRLRVNNRFTEPSRSRAMAEEFERVVSPVLAFLDECCEVSDGAVEFWVEKSRLFEKWSEWCKARGSAPSTTASFGQSLVNTGKGIKANRRGPRGSQFTTYDGVKLC